MQVPFFISFYKMLQAFTKHKFHLVNRSQLPFLTAGFAMLLTMSIVFYLHTSNLKSVVNWDTFLFHTSFAILNLIIISWFLNIIFESGKGYHTKEVQQGLSLGFWLFIISEAMLFFSFFWAYFHYKLNPSVSIATLWPPVWDWKNSICSNEYETVMLESIQQPFNPFTLPLLNTILLLSSGYTANISHKAILEWDFNINTLRQKYFMQSLLITILLGYVFLCCQGIEYSYGLPFSWMSNVYWSIFFLLTGFHGIHVLIGTLFLHINFIRFCCCRIFDIESILKIFFNILITILFYKTIVCYYTNYIVTKVTLKFNNKQILTEIQKEFVPLYFYYKNYLERFSRIDLSRYSITHEQHLGYTASLYYWHFVDSVWILLYMVVYMSWL